MKAMTNVFRFWFPVLLFSIVLCLFIERSESIVYSPLRHGKVLQSNDKLEDTENERKLQSKLLQFMLINADTDTIISDLMQNAVVDIGSVPASSLTIEVLAEPGSTHQSAEVTLTGAQNYKNVEHGKIVLCGNSGSNYATCDFLTVGKYNLKVDLYSKTGGAGLIIGSDAINFELKKGMTLPVPVSKPTIPPIKQPTTAPVAVPNTVAFTLINGETDLPFATLTQKSVVNIGNVAAKKLNILVTGTGIAVKSGRISLSGPYNISKVENGVLALCGNNGANFYMCNNMKLGKYTITAELYSLSNAGGPLSARSTIDFELTSTISTTMTKQPTTLPKRLPTSAPNRPPSTSPNRLLTATPKRAPTNAPNRQPTATPKRSPTNAPNKLPTFAPNRLPTLTPNKLPTFAPATSKPTAPKMAPVAKPTSAPAASCSIPKFQGEWMEWEKYPIPIAESMGAIVGGKDLVIVSGFSGNFDSVTKEVYAYDVTNLAAKWRKMDDVPVPIGFHHAAYVVIGSIMHVCGAYTGGVNSIKDSPVCLTYNHTAPPLKQWSYLPALPAGRGGGGMNHIVETNSLVYATGATRPPTVDWSNTWELSLNNVAAGWVPRADIPYKANHISHVTAYYNGKPHYYWTAGQLTSNEANGNVKDLFEWDQSTKTWIRRQDMPFARGHASASTIAYGCGFLMIGGAINSGISGKTEQTATISYYGIDTNTWTNIGELPKKINTPVCVVVPNVAASDWVYCQTGSVGGSFSWKRKISL